MIYTYTSATISYLENREKSPPIRAATLLSLPLTMRVLSLLLAAGTALASSSSSSPSDATSSPVPDEPTPAGQTWLAKWTDATLSSYTKTCATKATFKAQIYTLGEMYPTLKEWAPQLKVFYNKQHYPGSWEGQDVHGTGRELLKMALEDVPFKVREWCVCPLPSSLYPPLSSSFLQTAIARAK